MGVGFPRCGTSWIAKQLKDHPEVCFSVPKEVHFFDRERNRQKGFSHYSSHFEHCVDNQVVGEYTTSYFLSNQILEDIKNNYPNIKLIVSVRNPIDRAFSNYLHNKKRKGFKRTFTKEISDKNSMVLTSGFYHSHLSRIFNYFPKEQVHVIIFDDIKERPEEVMRGLCDYLDVSYHSVADFINEKVNSHNIFNFKSVYLNRNLKWIEYEVLHGRLNFIHKLFKGTIFSRFFYYLLQKNKKTKATNKKEVICEDDKEKLINLYKEDIGNLSELLGVDLSHWVT